MDRFTVGTEEKESFAEEEETSEDGFMRGYHEEDGARECAECGAAIHEEQGLSRPVDGEDLTFCSSVCADEYEDSI